MKTKNSTEIKAIAKGIFERYPNAQKVAVTSDGMAFITDVNELGVKGHSKNNRYKKELKIERFTRDDFAEETPSDKPKTADQLISEIESATTVEVVAAIIEAEEGGKKRKTVLEAGNAKLESLKADV